MRSNHVDVVIAEGDPHTVDLPHEEQPTVDVAPDPARRIIILAPTKPDGEEYAAQLNITPVAIVTPRAPHAARGMVADDIEPHPDLAPEDREALLPEVLPALETMEG
jgi:hypothetical protein